MNLSTAKSVSRATEIAVKKTLGSGKKALVFSFLSESILMAFISLIIAIELVFIVLKITPFNDLMGKNLQPDFFNNPVLLTGSLLITLGIGIISGLYPAFYLPNIPTLTALKGSYKSRKSGHALRRILITTQFAISIFVVVCTLFMQDQIDFVRNRELGFDKENVLVLPIQDTLVEKQIGAIKNEFLQNPHITAATTSYNVLGNVGGKPVMWAEGEEGMKQQAFALMVVGDDYLKTMHIPLTSGRDFGTGPKADVEDVFIANEAAAKLMGWNNNGVGKKVKFFHAEKDGQVIGIVKDFNFSSLHNAIEPLLIIKSRTNGGFLHLKVSGNDLPETISFIKDRWSGYDSNHPFEYFFLDQRFDEQYKADQVQYSLLSGLSYICIFISLLGLLGLSAFTATQRTKEIGIRKVHGASTSGIIYMLYKEIMYLVIIATIIVVPVSYYITSQWVGNFAYQTNLSYITFIMVALFALFMAFLTVAFHSLKTARTNPVESLKYE